jgi:hypothetical protein
VKNLIRIIRDEEILIIRVGRIPLPSIYLLRDLILGLQARFVLSKKIADALLEQGV